ncbi:Uncharacterised protein [BD1-7 clade bacterium]|uniref:Uncharacterized protein n=1 Tax=BD1-7 clade bacterium TaxID=2029982 RepID=A0A5S9N437_9GAMM|nr:Uncharacterised protein [BD1-7 clade bacterium]CAA0084617.1 Uncharacterised protein [BD1-7 clade bacterium]
MTTIKRLIVLGFSVSCFSVIGAERTVYDAETIDRCASEIKEFSEEQKNIKVPMFTGTQSQVEFIDMDLTRLLCYMDLNGSVDMSSDFFGDGFTVDYVRPGFKIAVYFSKIEGGSFVTITKFNGEDVHPIGVAANFPTLQGVVRQPVNQL